MVQDQGHDPGEHFPQVRHHPHFGEVTFVEFGAMLMQSMPQLSANEDFARTVSTEWFKLPMAQSSGRGTPRAAHQDVEQAITQHGTDPGAAPSGASGSGLSLIDRLRGGQRRRQRSEQGGNPSVGPQLRSIRLPPAPAAPMQQFSRNDILASMR